MGVVGGTQLSPSTVVCLGACLFIAKPLQPKGKAFPRVTLHFSVISTLPGVSTFLPPLILFLMPQWANLKEEEAILRF